MYICELSFIMNAATEEFFFNHFDRGLVSVLLIDLQTQPYSISYNLSIVLFINLYFNVRLSSLRCCRQRRLGYLNIMMMAILSLSPERHFADWSVVITKHMCAVRQFYLFHDDVDTRWHHYMSATHRQY